MIDTYRAMKDSLLASGGISDTTMHVHAGMAIYVAAQVALRTRRGSANALIVVFFIESLNEIMDRLYWGSWRWPDTLSDFTATLFWPAIMAGVSQYRRTRWAKAKRLSDIGRNLLQIGMIQASQASPTTQARGDVR